MEKGFNVRVYGLWLNANNELLICDEDRSGTRFTKFPGGGLEQGEGTLECLQRECMEEMSVEVNVQNHFYTTDFCQLSRFDQSQIIAIYYKMNGNVSELKSVTKPFDFGDQTGKELLAFRWRPLLDIQPDELTFPIDKVVLNLLKENV